MASLGKAATGLGKIALFSGAGLAVGGLTALSGALVSGIGDAREATQVMAATENVIRSMGRTGKISAEQIAEMAGSLSAAEGKSLFGDSDIQAGQNMLLTFANINEVLPDATQAMVDMTQFMGGDMTGAATMLGKALDNPTQGLSALSRVGVSFTEQQKEQIKTMQEAGNMAGAQGIILQALESQFGGAAEAAARADGGWAQFNDRMGELAESVGARVLPVLNQLLGWLNSEGVQTGITQAVDVLTNGVIAIGNGISQMMSAFQSGGFAGLIDLILPKLQEFGTGIVTWITEQAPIWAAQLLTWGQAFVDWISPYIPPLLEKLGEFATAAWTWIQEQVPIWLEKLGEWGVQLVAWVLPQIPVLLENLAVLIGNVVIWIGEQLPAIKNSVKQWGDALYTWVKEVAIPGLEPAFTEFDTAMGGHMDSLMKLAGDKGEEVGDEIAKRIREAMSAGLPAFRDETLPAWSDAIFTWLNETAPLVIPGAQAIGQSIIDAIREKQAELIPMLDGWATSIHTWLTETAGKVVTWATEVGTNMITGMVNGVTAQATALATAAANVVRDAIQAAKDAILSRSPSRKTRDEIGKPMGEGIVVGIEGTATSIKQAIGKTILGAIQVAALAPEAIKSGKAVAEKFKQGLAEGLESTENLKQIFGGKLRAAIELADEDVKQIFGGKIRAALETEMDAIGRHLAETLVAGFNSRISDFNFGGNFGGAGVTTNFGDTPSGSTGGGKGDRTVTAASNSSYTIMVDARGSSDSRAVYEGVQRALREAGIRTDLRLRTT